jgi:DNA-directed RNA polymerase specialized sigma24 family protein
MWATGSEGYSAFFAEAEPRLRRALVAALGPERGREGAAEALAYAWQHWEEVRRMRSPIGYLFRVGQSRSRPRATAAFEGIGVPDDGPWIEPGLSAALASLSERERLAVVLVEGFGWTWREVAELADISTSSVQSYLRRGLEKLRNHLGALDVS